MWVALLFSYFLYFSLLVAWYSHPCAGLSVWMLVLEASRRRWKESIFLRWSRARPARHVLVKCQDGTPACPGRRETKASNTSHCDWTRETQHGRAATEGRCCLDVGQVATPRSSCGRWFLRPNLARQTTKKDIDPDGWPNSGLLCRDSFNTNNTTFV